MIDYETLERLVEELEPYENATGYEFDELLQSLLGAASHYSYHRTDEFTNALIKELSTIKEEYETKWEWETNTVTRTETYKTLVWKG